MLGERDSRHSQLSQHLIGDHQQIPHKAPSSVGAERRPSTSETYGLGISLQLPHDGLSPRLARRLVRYTLEQLDVIEDVISDIELALTEACGNVLNHAASGDSYDVTVTIRPHVCELRVIDVGHGFDYQTVRTQLVGTDDEGGRGLAIMHAVMDRVQLDSEPERGTLVHLTKRLVYH